MTQQMWLSSALSPGISDQPWRSDSIRTDATKPAAEALHHESFLTTPQIPRSTHTEKGAHPDTQSDTDTDTHTHRETKRKLRYTQ